VRRSHPEQPASNYIATANSKVNFSKYTQEFSYNLRLAIQSFDVGTYNCWNRRQYYGRQ
jgi:hypothetical protein